MNSQVEQAALDEFSRRLSGQGYTVVQEPGRAHLPDFLRDFQPDAIATGRLPFLLIEVLTRRGSGAADAAKIEQLRALLSEHSDWKLEVLYTGPGPQFPKVASVAQIRSRYASIERIAEIDRPAALILSWSVLEAITRLIDPRASDQALGPSSMVEYLASLGHIDQSQAEQLRRAGKARNLIVHGDLSLGVSQNELTDVLVVLDALIRQIEERR